MNASPRCPLQLLGKAAAFTLLAVTLFAAAASAADPADSKSAKGDNSRSPAPATNMFTVSAEPFSVNVELGATVEARDLVEVSIVPEEWPDLVVVEAVQHGARVKRGTTLVKFDTQRIEQAIRDQEAEARLNAQALRKTREGLTLLKQSLPLQMAEAERAARQANEDLKEFLEKGRPRTLVDLDFQLKAQEFSVAYAAEELKQLEKMYKADDLVEETEKIVLQRSRFQLESVRHQFKQFQAQRQWQLTYGLPRQETVLKNAAAQSSLGWQRAQVALPQAVLEQEVSLAKLEYEDVKKQQRLAGLKRDRGRLTLRSPRDGVVYYGRATRGAWPGADLAGGAVAVGAQVKPHQVLLSIVDPQTVRLRATAEESQLRQLRQGLRGTFRPAVDPKQSLPAMLGAISPVPIATGRFDVEIDADVAAGGKGLAAPLMPGMACQARFTVYANPKAIVVPATAVKSDPDEQSYVMLLDADGNLQRRDVKIGEKLKDKLEIVEGLKAGDKIQLLEEKK